jgi:hypothetical protein
MRAYLIVVTVSIYFVWSPEKEKKLYVYVDPSRLYLSLGGRNL